MVPKAPKGPGDRWNPEVLKNRYFLKYQRGRSVLMGRGDLGDHLVLAVQEIQLGLAARNFLETQKPPAIH
jgi:hypothetical protein